MDVMEIDGASNRRIEEVRNLRDNINYAPSEGRYRIYIIDEVHMLTNEAFNALLKTLEEPPSHAVFIFATTEIHRVPPTILSRCQRFDFKRIPINTIIEQLKDICVNEKIDISADALMQIAKKADGSMRDGQSILDQIISFSGEKITLKEVEQAIGVINQEIFFDISDKIKEQNLKSILLLSRELFASGIDLMELLLGLEEHFRNMLVAASMNSVELLDVSDNFAARYQEQIGTFTENDLVGYLNIISQTLSEMKWAQQPFLKLELALVKMAKMPSAKNIEEILEKVELLKKKHLNDPRITETVTLADDAQILDLQKIKNFWPDVVSLIHASKPTLANVFQLVRIKDFIIPDLYLTLTCNNGQKSIVEKNIIFIAQALEQVFGIKIKPEISYDVQANGTDVGKTNNNEQHKDKLKKFEKLKAKDPLFKKLVDEFGLEPE